MAAVTLTDVARRAGVSQPTASRVLNGSKRKPAAHMVEAVRKAAAELGYVPNAQAQALARSTTGLLGLIVHDIADPYFSAVAGGVQLAASAHERQMMLTSVLREPAQELAAIEAFIAHRTDAIIIVGSRWQTPEAEEVAVRMAASLGRYTGNGGRVAVIGQAMPNAHAVVPNNYGGAAVLAQRLVDQGLREFAVLAGPAELTAAADRTAGYLSVLESQGLRPRQVINGSFTRDGGYDAATQAAAGLAKGASLCLLAVNDVMALGAMTALRTLGKRVPRDVQVAGFDDIPTLRDHSPSLTTVRLPLQAMGERAVELALTADPGGQEVEQVAGEVILRESTGPAEFNA